MFKDILKKDQPIIYKILTNTMDKNTNHAFLIVGSSSSFNRKLSLFMAQSLICNNDVLACEKCNDCLRINDNNYSDLIIYDGSLESIKKEDILNISSKFSKTALEENGKKVYILNSIENCSISAINSLLKFLEEPSDNTYAILTCENLKRVLPTIVSRCQIINVRNLNSLIYKDEAIKDGVDLVDAYILSKIKPLSIKETFESEEYQLALLSFKKFINEKDDLYGVLLYIQNSIFTKKTENNIIILTYFIDILLLFLKDKQLLNINGLGWYSELLDKIDVKDYSELMLILVGAKDKLKINNFNVTLILDQLFYKIITEASL